jgi:pyrimidine operon attenuation protein / uracil phosphoribosyltransferase
MIIRPRYGDLIGDCIFEPMQADKVIINPTLFNITIKRLCYQLIENYQDFENTALIGIQPRGVHLAKRIHQEIKKIKPNLNIPYGELDITFHRDDFRRGEPLKAQPTKMDFLIEGKKIVMIDDVLYTGRTIRAALDAMLAFGRPSKVELLVLIDRRYARDLPIEPNYIGQSVDTIVSEKVKVSWKETTGMDEVRLSLEN